jgi:hypothetical protein
MGVSSDAIILEVHAASGSVDPQREARGLVLSPEYKGKVDRKNCQKQPFYMPWIEPKSSRNWFPKVVTYPSAHQACIRQVKWQHCTCPHTARRRMQDQNQQ